MKLNAIIVEDEQTSRDILKNYLKKYCPNVVVLGEAENIDEALVLIRNHELDLVFLDVEMPYGNAFDLLDKLGDVNFETVFCYFVRLKYRRCSLRLKILAVNRLLAVKCLNIFL